jgi:hypothetical protein
MPGVQTGPALCSGEMRRQSWLRTAQSHRRLPVLWPGKRQTQRSRCVRICGKAAQREERSGDFLTSLGKGRLAIRFVVLADATRVRVYSVSRGQRSSDRSKLLWFRGYHRTAAFVLPHSPTPMTLRALSPVQPATSP